MAVEDKQDYTEAALARLPDQFVNSTNLINLVSISSDRFQGLNDEAIKILDGRSLSLSSGKQLNNIATILNLTRISGESDEDFRARILSETSALARSGEPSHVIDIYLLLTDATSVFYAETYPAGFQLTAHVAEDAEDDATDASTLESMRKVKGGGIGMVLVISTETDYFMLDSSVNVDGSGNGTSSADHGLGSSTDVDGGQISRLLI